MCNPDYYSCFYDSCGCRPQCGYPDRHCHKCPPRHPCEKGDPGTNGVNGIGAIIPYGSGFIVPLTVNTGTYNRVVGIIGFGNSTTENTTLSTNLTSIDDFQGFAFVAPRNLSLSAISLAAVGQNVTATAPSLTAQIYTAPANSTTFSPLNGAFITITAPTTGTATGGTTNLTGTIYAGTRILYVVYATSTNATGDVDVYINGSLATT